MIKPKILFVTQTLGYKIACGIGLIGDLYGRTLCEHKKYDVELFYCDDVEQIKQKIRDTAPNAVLYNYSPVSTPWVDDISLRQGEFEHIPQARVMHDIHQEYIDCYQPEYNYNWKFNFTSDNVLVGNKYIFPTTRVMPPSSTIPYKESTIPIIGYQGFGFRHKGIDKIAHQVVKEFDEAVLRLHIPYSFYGDYQGILALQIVDEVKQIVSVNPKIEVIASHEMLDTQQIIDLISQNTINCYFYDYMNGHALSSSLDYGFSAKRPIAVTRSHQMRNVWNLTPSILIEESSLKTIISNGIEPLNPIYELYTIDNFLDQYDKGLQILLNQGI